MKNGLSFTGKIRVALLSLLCCLLWGSAFPTIKICFSMLNITEPFAMIELAGYRFFLAGIIVLAFVALTRIPLLPTRKESGIIVILALIQTFGVAALNYIGMAYTTSAKASILTGTEIFFTIILSHLAFENDKMDLKKLTGLLLGATGIVFVNFSGENGFEWSFSFIGEGFILITTMLASISFILIKKKSTHINLLRVNGWQLLLGGLLLLLFGYGGYPHIIALSWESGALLLYMALLSAVAFSIWFFLLQNNHASEVTIYKFAMPVFGVIFSAFILKGESITFSMITGLILVVFGIFTANYKKTRPSNVIQRRCIDK